MMQIEMDFDVFKALTAQRRHEGHSPNDVLRQLFDLPPSLGQTLSEELVGVVKRWRLKGFPLRGGELPDGTDLRATYKGAEYRASICSGASCDEGGDEHSSPSAAAGTVSGTNVNGLLLWHVRRPGDENWTRLDILVATGA